MVTESVTWKMGDMSRISFLHNGHCGWELHETGRFASTESIRQYMIDETRDCMRSVSIHFQQVHPTTRSEDSAKGSRHTAQVSSIDTPSIDTS